MIREEVNDIVHNIGELTSADGDQELGAVSKVRMDSMAWRPRRLLEIRH